MKFVAGKEDLLNGIRIVERATVVKGLQPVLANVLIERRARKANRRFIYEARPAFFHKTFCPFRVSRFILVSLCIDD